MKIKKYSKSFITLIESLHLIHERLIWLPISIDDSEENIIKEIYTLLSEYNESKE